MSHVNSISETHGGLGQTRPTSDSDAVIATPRPRRSRGCLPWRSWRASCKTNSFQPVTRHDAGIPVHRGLLGALARGEIDVVQAEAVAGVERPFDVVPASLPPPKTRVQFGVMKTKAPDPSGKRRKAEQPTLPTCMVRDSATGIPYVPRRPGQRRVTSRQIRALLEKSA